MQRSNIYSYNPFLNLNRTNFLKQLSNSQVAPLCIFTATTPNCYQLYDK